MSICIIYYLPTEFYINFYINYELEANPFNINMDSVPPGGPSGPIVPRGVGNSGFNGYPGPGGNKPPNNYLGMTQISNKFNNDLLDKRYDYTFKAETFPEPLPKGTLHIGKLKMDELIYDQRPEARSIQDHTYEDIRNMYYDLPLETFNPSKPLVINSFDRHGVTCTYCYQDGIFRKALLQGPGPQDCFVIVEWEKFTLWYYRGEFVSNRSHFDITKFPGAKT